MIRRSFLGLARPKLKYQVAPSAGGADIRELATPSRVSLFLDSFPVAAEELIVRKGQKVTTGKKVILTENVRDYVPSPVTGTVTDIADRMGYLGRTYPSISIDVDKEDRRDQEFAMITGGTPGPETASRLLGTLPGAPGFGDMLDPGRAINTVIINGTDSEPLIRVNQHVAANEVDDLMKGIDVLREIVPAGRFVMVVPPSVAYASARTGVEIRKINTSYPDTLPRMIVKKVTGTAVPQGRSLEEMGIGFVNAEAVAALGRAFSRGEPPVRKLVTVIRKDFSTLLVRVRIGTHVGEILDALNLETTHGDRLILGGPMTGQAVFSGDVPVMFGTDGLMLQDKGTITSYSDSQCVNCGECVRACPAGVPVNMLVRLLENGLYEDAVERYDLLSCIECGLCSYVCIARIPVFQYVMLGKYEFDRIKRAEESNA